MTVRRTSRSNGAARPAVVDAPVVRDKRASPDTERASRSAEELVRAIGTRIRLRREQLGLSLRDVAGATGLSVSMVSLAERARTVPSIGTLVMISDALHLPMAELFTASQEPLNPVVRQEEQQILPSSGGVTRRIVIYDAELNLEVSQHEYERGGSSSSTPTHHSGREVGIVINGQLTVELAEDSHVLNQGDCIRFDSTVPHRFSGWNRGRTRTMWLNYGGRPSEIPDRYDALERREGEDQR